jgi:hypothetical protein
MGTTTMQNIASIAVRLYRISLFHTIFPDGMIVEMPHAHHYFATILM